MYQRLLQHTLRVIAARCLQEIMGVVAAILDMLQGPVDRGAAVAGVHHSFVRWSDGDNVKERASVNREPM